MQNLYTRRQLQAGRPETEAPVYRIGGVSRLAGVPVTTLRVWERRYAAFVPAKSEGQHRLYGDDDVIRARLLRQLTEAGHSIGTIAHLDAHALQQRLVQVRGAAEPQREPAPGVSVVVVGEALAARLNSPQWRGTDLGHTLDIQGVFADLEAVEASPVQAPAAAREPDLLLVRFNTLQANAGEQLARAIAQLRAKHAIVLYVYAARTTVDALRAAGMIVRREPVGEADLAELIRSQVVVDAAGTIASVRTGALIPPRRFSDATLASIAARPSHMLCECPRHIAELVTQLASFEEYSRDCLNTSTQDAQVHAYLRSVAGSARALFERALEMVALHDGLELPVDQP
jgi:MerR family transcriptional regulator, light-induced transcriptional regulator